MRFRSLLLLLAALVLVPGLVAAVVAVGELSERARETALRGLSESVRAASLLVDGQILRSMGALAALGASPSVSSGDFRVLYEEAKAIDLPPDVWTLALDQTGTQVLNTAVPFGTPPPPPSARERVARVLATGKPLISDVIVGPVTGRLLTTIYVPAASTPSGRLVVAQAYSVEHWARTALQPRGRPDWIVGIFDRSGRFISRSHRSEEFLGKPARPELVAAAAGAAEGLIRHRTLEGIEVYDAFVHSTLTGWTIAIAAPVETIDASARQSVALIAVGLAVGLMLALVGASLIARRILAAVDSGVDAARALGEGRPPTRRRPTAVREIDALNEALVTAGELLGAESEARRVVEAERQRLLDAAQTARLLAQDESRAKDVFLAQLGHELRNPLATIEASVEAMRLGGADPALRAQFLDILKRQSATLARLVDDLLDVGRLVGGKITLELEPIDLAAHVHACVQSLASSARAGSHRVVVDAAEPVRVRGDAVRLEQVVANLIGNAFKFSPAGSEVVVRVYASAGRALLEVRDQGIGIEPALLARLFEPFVQGPAASGRALSGLGIGLALVKQLVELHGGTIEARSGGSEGGGTTFVVSLPRIDAA